MLDVYLSLRTLDEITGDVIWSIVQKELKRGNKPATVNRYLALIRNLLRTARDEWQWIDTFPLIRLLPGEVERDRWLTREETDRLIKVCPPHLAALIRFALSTGCRASEITGLEWERVDLDRRTAWLNRTKNGTSRGVPLNRDAVAVLEEQNRQAFSVLLYLSRRADPLGRHQHGLAQRAREGRLERCALSRSAPHLGVMASAGWDELRRAEGPGGMEVAQNGGPVREVCDREPDRRGGKDREQQAGGQRDTAVTFVSRPKMTKGYASA